MGIHTILQLLQQEYIVNTTLRSLSKKDNVIRALNDGGLTVIKNLHFFEADLTADKGWMEAIEGCDYVLHVASPFPLVEPKDEDELIVPARDGSLRVLKAAKSSGVKRVVLTSSFAAIGYGTKRKNHIFTEEDWTDENVSVAPYIKSKTIAEKAAWEFIKNEGGDMELTVINPVGIFGPVIGDSYPASFEGVIKAIIEGTVTESPAFTFGVVDVRDVADIHIKAMLHPEAGGHRFLATSEGVVSFYDVAQLIKKERPDKAGKVVSMKPTPEEFYIDMSNNKACAILGWQPKTKEEAIIASVDSSVL